MSWSTFTIIPRTWEYSLEELAGVDPRKLLRAFRAALRRVKGRRSGGRLFAYIHGEYDPRAKVVRLHLHGVADGEMVAMLDGLRTLRAFKATRKLPDGTPSPVWTRVWIRRKPLVDLPDPLTYLVQSFWPARPIYVSKEGKRFRLRQKGRLREPYHSQVLLWLDRWRLDDLILLVGLRVTTAGLTSTEHNRGARRP